MEFTVFYLDGIVPDVDVILGNNLGFLVCTSFHLKFHIPHIIILIISPEIAHIIILIVFQSIFEIVRYCS